MLYTVIYVKKKKVRMRSFRETKKPRQITSATSNIRNSNLFICISFGPFKIKYKENEIFRNMRNDNFFTSIHIRHSKKNHFGSKFIFKLNFVLIEVKTKATSFDDAKINMNSTHLGLRIILNSRTDSNHGKMHFVVDIDVNVMYPIDIPPT